MRKDVPAQTLRSKPGRDLPPQKKAQRPSARTNPDGDNVKSALKILPILQCFSTMDRKLAVTEIVKRTGLPRATAHRIISTLKEMGFLEQDKERDHYRLGLKLFEFGSMVLANMDPPPRFGELAALVKHHASSISAQLGYRA